MDTHSAQARTQQLLSHSSPEARSHCGPETDLHCTGGHDSVVKTVSLVSPKEVRPPPGTDLLIQHQQVPLKWDLPNTDTTEPEENKGPLHPGPQGRSP